MITPQRSVPPPSKVTVVSQLATGAASKRLHRLNYGPISQYHSNAAGIRANFRNIIKFHNGDAVIGDGQCEAWDKSVDIDLLTYSREQLKSSKISSSVSLKDFIPYKYMKLGRKLNGGPAQEDFTIPIKWLKFQVG